MSSMELEIKIKNVNEKDLIAKIESLGGNYISTSNQYLYLYDLKYINQRFFTDLYEYNHETSLKKDVCLSRIKNLFFEIDQILTAEDISFLQNNYNAKNLSSLFNFKNIGKILNDSSLLSFLDKFKSTPKKWIRLRKTVEEKLNGEINISSTLTVKHILKDDISGIQQMKETEIIVDSFDETNDLLECIGFSHRGYQEKRIVKCILENYEIDIETWPGLPTYFEVEGKDKKDLEYILNLLGYSFDEAFSCTADEFYKEIGIDANNIRELKF